MAVEFSASREVAGSNDVLIFPLPSDHNRIVVSIRIGLWNVLVTPRFQQRADARLTRSRRLPDSLRHALMHSQVDERGGARAGILELTLGLAWHDEVYHTPHIGKVKARSSVSPDAIPSPTAQDDSLAPASGRSLS